MSDDLVVIDDFQQSDEALQFMELVAEFLKRDPHTLHGNQFLGQINLRGQKLEKFAKLITEEYDIPMTVEDFEGLTRLRDVWKWIEESYEDDHVLNHDGAEDEY